MSSHSKLNKCRRFKKYGQQGFSLVEVLMAITVLSVGLVCIVQAMGRTQQALRMSENLSLASQITDEQITRFELHTRERGNPGYGADGKEIYPGKEFQSTSRVQPFQDATMLDSTTMNLVSSEVRWVEAGRDKNLRSYSLIMNRGKK